MKWDSIVGQGKIIQILRNSIKNKRISHAQLFWGEEGYGVLPLALAYSQEILVGENSKAVGKVETFNHLDLHFSYPVFTENKQCLSKRHFDNWRNMILKNPYSSFSQWTEILYAENKQLIISADEVEDFSQKLTLKSYEGGTKILIIWYADKINTSASNKLLKFLEEPPKDTIIILLAKSTENILPTILSRCQIIEIPRIEEKAISDYLIKHHHISYEEAKIFANESQGNLNEALRLLSENDTTEEFEKYFIEWVRNAFQAKKKPQVLKEILYWARDISSWNREKQKSFLDFSSDIFRLALMQNYTGDALVYKKIKKENFNWKIFSSFIHGANIEDILHEISETEYHLSRNANSKIVLTDIGIKLSRLLHRKST